VDDGAWATAPARVGLLGPITVQAPATIDATRAGLAAEVVAYLSVHPGGVHPNVLAGAIWPRGVSTQVRDATIARVRDWLGTDPDGNYRLHQYPNAHLALAGVPTDWHAFTTLAAQARQAGDPTRERDLLARALHLVRGPFAADPPPGRYAWLARTGLETTVAVIVADTAHRLTELLLHTDPPAAAQAARSGLRADPGNQLLWRDLLWTHHTHTDPETTRHIHTELLTTLSGLQVDLEPETEALLDELLPHDHTLDAR
jgi:hypothetical protein